MATRWLWCVIVAMLALPLLVHAQEGSFDNAVWRLAAKVRNNKERIVVYEIEAPPQHEKLAKKLRLKLEEALGRMGATVLTRDLEEIIARQKMQRSAMFDRETMAKVGRLANASAILRGKLLPDADGMELHLQLVEVESGKLLVAASGKIPQMEKRELCEQYRAWLPTPPDNKGLRITMALEQATVRVEQAIGISYNAGDSGFVYLFNIVESGQTQLLLPLAGYKKQPQNRVRAGAYRYPPDDADFPFEASAFIAQQPGQELFVALLAERPIRALEQAVERAWIHAKDRAAKGEDYDNLVPLTAHDMEQTREEIRQGRWGWSLVELTIGEK